MSNCLIAYFSCAYDHSGEHWKYIKFNNGTIVNHIVGDMDMPPIDIKTVVMDRVRPYIDPSVEWEDWVKLQDILRPKGIIEESDNIQSFSNYSDKPTHLAAKHEYQIKGKVGNCLFQIDLNRIYFREKEGRLTKVP